MSRIETLARHARALKPEHLPADVARRAALQHLSMAAVIRSARPGDPQAWPLLGTEPGREALRDAGHRSALREYEDYGFFGHASHGAVLGAWAAGGERAADLYAATAIATEVAGRIGALTLLQRGASQARVYVPAAAAATAIGWLRGLDARQLANALALVLHRPQVVPVETLHHWPARGDAVADALIAAWDAVEAAARGDAGDTDLLDEAGVASSLDLFAPLPSALDGLGGTWYGRATTFRLTPGAPALQTALQATEEIVRRHLKAASKPLRPDQVERIEVELDHGASWQVLPLPAGGAPDDGALPYTLAHAIGVIVTVLRGGPAIYDPAVLEREGEAVRSVAEKVEVRPDTALSARWLHGNVPSLAPLLASVPVRERLPAIQRALRHPVARGKLQLPDRRDLGDIVAARPQQLLDLMRLGEPGPLRSEGMHLARPVRVTIHTIRGGRWVEEREVVEGGPEYPLAELEHDVVEKYAVACGWKAGEVDATAADAARRRADDLLARPDRSGKELLDGLGAR